MNSRRLLPTLLAAAALALPATPAAAATHVLRPTGTVGLSTWSTPLGASLSSVLDDALTRPARPGPGDEATVSGPGLLWDGIVALSSPTFAAGETPTATRIAIFAEVGPNATLTATLWRGLLPLRFFSVPAGAKADWYVSDPIALSADQLQGLTLGLHVNALSGPTTTKVKVATVEVDATDPSAPAAAPAGDDAGNAPGDSGRGEDSAPASEDEGADGTPNAPAAVEVDNARPLVLGARAADVPVDIGCLASAGCRGRIVLQLTTPAGPKGKHARAARCARGCRILGQAGFRIASGKRKNVKVRVAKAARRLLPAGRTVRATAVVTTRDPAGRTSVVSRAVSIRRSS